MRSMDLLLSAMVFAYRSTCRQEYENGGTEAKYAVFGAVVTAGQWASSIIVIGAQFTDAQFVML